LLSLFVTLGGLAGTLGAQTTARPEDVDLSSEVLARIGPAMQALVDSGRTAGVMSLVARRGEIVHWQAAGWRVLGEDALEPDDIFRIYSMTKPVTSVAAMILVEEGRLSLDTPLADVLPAFANVQVADSGRLRTPARPILIRHLLTHTAGFGYGDIGRTPVDSLYRAARLGVWGTAGDLEQTVDAIARLPLIFDPGARWNYSMGVDVLGRVVEVVSGETLEDFFRERIFEPLRMEDTGFHVVADELDRFTGGYAPSPQGLRVIESPIDGQHTRPAQWFSGGGGLTSTASDYLRFTSMLLNEGELDGVRLLRPETVEQMRSNQLPPELVPIPPIVGQNYGFGLGFAVSMGENAGSYRWLGIEGTYFWIDPTQDLIVFAWNQLRPSGGAPIERVMADIVYDAILEPTASIVQPGAPGQPSRALPPGDFAVTRDVVRHTEADVRFMHAMIPHHAQALEMAALVPTRAAGEAVRQMALRMEISQRDEIAWIERWLRYRFEPMPEAHHGMDMPLMPGMLTPAQMELLRAARGAEFDRLFLELMIQHHEGAITMVETLFATSGAGQESETFQFANDVEVDQRMEIERMSGLLRAEGGR
jgi:CubicO group peptidase (beta-lactamase class C family)/predicted outer membrane protein